MVIWLKGGQIWAEGWEIGVHDGNRWFVSRQGRARFLAQSLQKVDVKELLARFDLLPIHLA